MGPRKGRPREGELPDMSIVSPSPPAYVLPDPDECEDVEDRVILDSGHELAVRFNLWKERLIVEFPIVQIVRHDGRWVEVHRIDTCNHGSVHRHQLHKRKPNDHMGKRTDLERIPAQNGWNVVDAWYDQALDLMMNDWKDNLRRWRSGSA